MDRKKIAVRAVVTAALIGASVVVAIALLSPTRTSDDQSSITTASTNPVLVDPNTADIPLDPVTTPPRTTTPPRISTTGPSSSVGRRGRTRPAGSATQLAPTLRGQPAVSWALSGSCARSGVSYSCHVAVKASNGLQSAGFVEAYAESGYRNRCVVVAPLAHGAVSLDSHCPYPFAPNVLVVYVLAPGPKAPVIAFTHLAWS